MMMFSIALLTFFVSLFILSLVSVFFVAFSLYRSFNGPSRNDDAQSDTSVLKTSLSRIAEKVRLIRESEPPRLANSLLLEIESSDSAKWDDGGGVGSRQEIGPGVETDDSRQGSSVKKKKRKGKKKKSEARGEEGESGGENCGETDKPASGPDRGRGKPELICLYPFTSTSSTTQRKIKQQYDQLVKCHETKGLTLTQVAEFANCLIEARNDLQHKSEVIKRKFSITKALLLKADRSSFDRLCQQVYKLEMEQKRLEDDAFVYNWLQRQLKLSPAYKKMLELSSCVELSEKPHELTESPDAEFTDISFEELLAQEKKDSFWQKNGRWRNGST